MFGIRLSLREADSFFPATRSSQGWIRRLNSKLTTLPDASGKQGSGSVRLSAGGAPGCPGAPRHVPDFQTQAVDDSLGFADRR
ncbi:MAG: hypothetical protein VST70_07835 [Nitrospirota bacterium]|nr:hypothetical protein [Nitrospirota bacterium]